ncbi:MAG: hypothetical protein MUF30_08645 [Burkholderiales bacterium]|jgi:hypothetical protein|nr:hypothetical protein [Burkholderiales bacterium]
MSGLSGAARAVATLMTVVAAQGAHALEGRVVALEPGCPHFVVQTVDGFMIYEHLFGPKPRIDDTIDGPLDRAGSWKARNVTSAADVMMYLEAGPIPQRKVEAKIPFKCKKNRPAPAEAPADR